jgi:hypothetical protein
VASVDEMDDAHLRRRFADAIEDEQGLLPARF